MKKILIGLAVLAVVGAAGAYFYFKGTTKHLQLVPKDAAVVMMVDFKSIALKSDFSKIKELKWVKELQNSSKAGEKSDSTDQKLKEIFENPMSTGINLMSNAYLFAAKNGEKDICGGIIFDIKDAAKFEETIKKVDPKAEISAEKNYKMMLSNGIALAWSSTGGIVGGTSQMSKEKTTAFLDATFSRTESESILSNQMFEKFEKGMKDFNMFVNFSEAMKLAKIMPGNNAAFVSALGINGDAYKDMYSWAYLDFGNDKISMNSHAEAPEATLAKLQILKSGGICSEHQNLITKKNVYAIFTANLDIDKLFSYYETIPSVKSYEQQVSQMLNMPVADLKNIIGGEISLALTDVKGNVPAASNTSGDMDEDDMSSAKSLIPVMPTIVFNFSSKNKDGVNKLLGMYTGGKNADGFYSMPLPVGTSINVVENKIGFTVTNDKDMAGTIAAKGSLGPLPANVIDLVKNNSSMMYMNLNIDEYPADLKTIVTAASADKSVAAVLAYMKLFKDITVAGNTHDSKLDLNFNKGEGNTLYRLFSQGDVAYDIAKSAKQD